MTDLVIRSPSYVLTSDSRDHLGRSLPLLLTVGDRYKLSLSIRDSKDSLFTGLDVLLPVGFT